VRVPPPNEFVTANFSRLLDRLEQMERAIRQIVSDNSHEQTSVAWDAANRVCDRYSIPQPV